MKNYDCIIIGGGFYGTILGLFLKEYFNDIIILEKENDILQRASFVNQARVHMGYHYPRSLITAYRSSVNFPKFITDFEKAIKNDFDKYYAISKVNSKVSANQFYSICKNLGSPISRAPNNIKEIFSDRMIEDVFKVKEFVFDAKILKEIIWDKLEENKCELKLNTEVRSVKVNNNLLNVKLNDNNTINGRFIFNCTYSGINTVLQNSGLPLLSLKHEITEMALIKLPDGFKDFAITVMDGPFFSIMPFPSRNLNTLSHVRYTPHVSWVDNEEYHNGYNILTDYKKRSNFRYMINDVKRYIPMFKNIVYEDSLFEVKTVQVKNERDDGRPILFMKDYGMKNFSNILGGKIDNIYEILDAIKETEILLNIKKQNLWNIFS
ncbi:FAD-dependent oxidoreductase [Candidatus Haliotispira prima]|uniref:FAD-dependent oxidoreductase n=1 Tax=Candidatus Haliotispira prima TaxID=3034016 RepID=A0ABY8MIH7_9SPIO|nr:FAD-dependent oxidoreductase [Candidatus Haliotispira prima]